MTDNFEQDLAARFRELDQPIQFDANELTTKLATIRNQRRRQQSKNRLYAAVSIGCLGILGFAFQLLPNGGDQPSVVTNTTEDDWTPISLVEFGLPVDSYAQAAELSRLDAELTELKRKSQAQQLTLVRESISRTMFSNDSTPSFFE